MRKVYAEKRDGKVIIIGISGEDFATKVLFQKEENASAILTVENADGQKYPVELHDEGQYLAWNVTRTDTFLSGYGRVEITYVLQDGTQKSVTYRTRVLESLTPPSGEVPDGLEDWYNRVITASINAIESAQVALEKAEEVSTNANVVAEDAETATNSANVAVESAESAQTSATEAGEHLEAIVALKEEIDSAAQVVSEKTEYVETARNEAETFKEEALTASQSAQDASDSAEEAKESAEQIAQNAETSIAEKRTEALNALDQKQTSATNSITEKTEEQLARIPQVTQLQASLDNLKKTAVERMVFEAVGATGTTYTQNGTAVTFANIQSFLNNLSDHDVKEVCIKYNGRLYGNLKAYSNAFPKEKGLKGECVTDNTMYTATFSDANTAKETSISITDLANRGEVKVIRRGMMGWEVNGKGEEWSNILAMVRRVGTNFCVAYWDDHWLTSLTVNGNYIDGYYFDGTEYIEYNLNTYGSFDSVKTIASGEELNAVETRTTTLETAVASDRKDIDTNTREINFLKQISKGKLYDIEEREEEGHAQLPSGAIRGFVDEVRGKTTQDNYRMGLAENQTTVEGCAESGIRELVMEGKTEQVQTNGYQLIDMEKITKSDIYADNWKYRFADGVISVNNDSGQQINGQFPITLEAGTYTFHADSITGGTAYAYFGDYNNSLTEYNLSRTFTLTETKTGRFQFAVINGQQATAVNVMLEKGSVAHPYEEFSNGFPSPSPEYPQEIESVERIDVKVTGKNLCDASKFTTNCFWSWSGDTHEPMDASYFPAGSVIPSASPMVYVKGFGSVTITTYCSSAGVAIIKFLDENKKHVMARRYGDVANADGNKATFTMAVPSNAVYVCATCDKDKENLVQIEMGSTATAYEPYTEQIVSITPPRPLNAIGEYKDMCDVEDGNWVYNTSDEEVTCDVNSGGGISSGGLHWNSKKFTDTLAVEDASVFKHIKGDKFMPVKVGDTISLIGDYGWSSRNPVLAVTSTGAYRVYAKEEGVYNVRFVFPVDTPTTEPIAEEDLTALRSLQTYSGTTNIFITDQNGNDISNHFRFKRAEGSAETDVVAPTPLYPSELESVEEIHVKHTGKNLLDKMTIKLASNVKGEIVYWDGFYGTKTPIKVSPNATYYYSDSNGSYIHNYIGYDKNMNIVHNMNWVGVNVLHIREDVEYVFIGSVGDILPTWCQFEKGSSATEFEPYREENHTIIPPRPLNRIGDYFDKADVESGEWKYATDVLDLGTLVWWLSNKGTHQAFGCSDWNHNPYNGAIISQKFTKNMATVSTGNEIGVYAGIKDRLYVCDGISDTPQQITDAMNGIGLCYVLEEPTSEPISTEGLEFLRNLELREGDNLFITDNHGRDVSYLMADYIDLKKAVE